MDSTPKKMTIARAKLATRELFRIALENQSSPSPASISAPYSRREQATETSRPTTKDGTIKTPSLHAPVDARKRQNTSSSSAGKEGGSAGLMRRLPHSAQAQKRHLHGYLALRQERNPLLAGAQKLPSLPKSNAGSKPVAALSTSM
ncbi:hypothetical protein ACJ73_06047 [Blastomyces percursus]|uniref:Uncharacterized protein n=1 Tax=Blastomyces percursus TaxID=1658174 RepID=A0A1J9R3K7_9EURO|nr:hypothetical protein ACJ73_06047 [Blastomyces percursus]